MKKIEEDYEGTEKKLLMNKLLKMNKEKINFMGKKCIFCLDNYLASAILPKINTKAEKLYGTKSFISKNLDPFD